ncbi:MAG TPA: tetratricopeptide repeat protein [Mycobacteriales bacterium]|nr:tetratricopeptide repeat protein [Mycobacteriales bacterium]
MLVAQYSQDRFEPESAGPFDDSTAGSDGFSESQAPPPDVQPQGEVYDWYTRGLALLEAGDTGAAMTLIGHAAQAEPESRSVREALARAQFDLGLYQEAVANFGWIVSVNPADDYAQFGLGLAAAKIGDLPAAVEHLALAAAMRPDISHYATALRGARSALASARR